MEIKEFDGIFSKGENNREKGATGSMDDFKSLNKIDLFSLGVLNSLSAHISVLDVDGNIIAVNNAWKKFAIENGEDSNAVSIGANYFNVCMQAINEDDQDALNALNGIKQVLSDERDEFEYEYACHSPDEQRWFLMRVTPMRFMGSKAVVVHINITDKKLAEMELIERESELYSLNLIGRAVSSSISLEEVVNATLEQISETIKPDVTMLFLKDGQKLLLSGMGPKNQANKYTINHVHQVGQCLCGLSVSTEESIFSKDIHLDNRCTWQECKLAGFTSFAAIPLKNRNKVIGTIGIGSIQKRDFEKRRQFLEAIVNDVAICLDKTLLYEKVKTYANELEIQLSERKKMEKVLLQRQKIESIGTLAGGIAHDFNNILASIIGFTEIAQIDAESGASVEDSLHEIYTAGIRARDLVKQILTFARQSDAKMQPVQMDKTFEEVLKFVRSTIPASIKINPCIESKSLIMGNAIQIHQVMMNLCTNAAHSMEAEGGILEVGLKDIKINKTSELYRMGLNKDDYFELTVSDTGTGIDPGIIGNIFEPYFTTKGVGKGTGMGLSLAHGIIESYGGKIMVESRLGVGSIFTIYLPIFKKGIPPVHSLESETLPTGCERILWVDDEVAITKMGKQNLEKLGYSVRIRNSSMDALRLFQTEPDSFDLVITDMTMPNMNGDKLAKELMNVRPDIPVILCTGYSKNVSAENTRELGIAAFAYKPLVKAGLANIVRKVLDEVKDKTQR